MGLCSFFDRPTRRDSIEVRRDHVLSAAERCFVRGGFHRSTMQDVAAEAQMSAGNVYRYFESKDAIVAGLVARDRAEVAKDFASLSPTNLMGSFAALMRRLVVDSGRDKAALWLEICAEATRNPAVRALTLAYEAEVEDRLAGFFDALIAVRSAEGRPRPATPPTALAGLVMSFLSGLMVAQAHCLGPDEAEQRVDALLGIVEALVDGRVPLGATPLVRAALEVAVP